MEIVKKFSSLTPEQRKKFDAVKDTAGLDAFIAETGITLTETDKTAVEEFFKTGALPLSDDDLDIVAGGSDKNDKKDDAKTTTNNVELVCVPNVRTTTYEEIVVYPEFPLN